MTERHDKRTMWWRYALIGALLVVVMAAAVADMVFLSATPDYADTRSVYIRPGDDLDRVTTLLAEADILEQTTGFEITGRVTGWGDQIKAGHYAIESGTSAYELLQTLRKGLQTPVRVRIPGGARKEQIVRALSRPMAFDSTAVTRAFADSALAASLGTDTTHLWAYMLPDTYFFYWLTEADDVIRRVKDSFDQVVDNASSSDNEVPLGLSTDQIVRLAGIVEWESGHAPEKPRLAGVYLNRLRDGWRLQADPTVQYALIQVEGGKRRLFFRDYEIDHPYNTYRFAGLPPGPITNPSASSVQASLNPESHNYYFFVAKGDGSHVFSRTLAEHRRNANEYYRVMREKRRQQEAAGGS